MRSNKGNTFVLIPIILIGLAAIAYVAYKLVNQEKTPSLNKQETAQIIVTPIPSSVDPIWETLISTKYKYQISYPETFTVQGSDKNPNEIVPSEYPNLSFTNYDDSANGLKLGVWANPNNISPKEWYTNEIDRTDKEKTECEKSNPNGPCPNISLRNITLEQESSYFKDMETYKTKMFRFDHADECILFTKYGNFYQICFDSEDPNDPKIEEHLTIYNKMLDSFKLLP